MSAPVPRFTILMALYNGAANLRMQIDSYLAQVSVDWRLIVSDDGSTDEGPAIVADYVARLGADRVRLIQGPRRGVAANFLALLSDLPEDAGYVAFSDQDDVWLPHKLRRAADLMRDAVPNDLPMLYCSRTVICDSDLGRQRPSARPPRPPSFRNALVQNIAAGNTIVLDPRAVAVLRSAMTEAEAGVLHDWWVYQIVTGIGGHVIFDDTPGLLYRQHPSNVVGANDGWRAAMTRLGMVLRGRYRSWNTANLAALAAAAHRLTPENRALLDSFVAARQSPAPVRLVRLSRLGLYRQTRVGQAGFWIAAALGRV